MELSFGLTIEQSQKLKLSPEIIQKITILQLNTFELESYVEEELLSNPLLEICEAVDKERSYDLLSYRLPGSFHPDDEEKNYEDFVKAQWSLSDFLQMQFQLVPGTSSAQKKIGKYIIDSLDDNGYRTERATLIAQKLGYSHDAVMETIKIIQGLEPPGIAAKSLEESLILQLERLGERDEIFDRIVNDHLHDLAANRLAVIAKDCGIALDKTQEYCDIIRGLNPKPGRAYGKNDDNRYITPDCYLDIVDGEYIISINEGNSPMLSISSYYQKLKNAAGCDADTLAYLEERMNSAMWLIKGIEQRRNTIISIAGSITRYQHDFFERGKNCLRPMTLAVIAEDVGVHESTVSRTVNGKYIQTPRGLFELKYFFGGGTMSSSGDQVVADNIREYIKDIIGSEDQSHPYSDETIRAMLSEKHGIDIARRTIAKYRDQLGILSISKRRRY